MPRTKKTNRLRAAKRAAPSRASGCSTTQAVTISQSEILTTVNSDGSKTGCIDIKPSNLQSGFLKTLSSVYTRMRWERVSISWRPALSNSSNGLIAYGLIDPDNCSVTCPATRQEISSFPWHVDHPIWNQSNLPVYSQSKWLSSCEDSPLKFVYALDATNCGCGTLIGEFLLTYCVQLSQPRFNPIASAPCPAANDCAAEKARIKQLEEENSDLKDTLRQRDRELKDCATPARNRQARSTIESTQDTLERVFSLPTNEKPHAGTGARFRRDLGIFGEDLSKGIRFTGINLGGENTQPSGNSPIPPGPGYTMLYSVNGHRYWVPPCRLGNSPRQHIAAGEGQVYYIDQNSQTLPWDGAWLDMTTNSTAPIPDSDAPCSKPIPDGACAIPEPCPPIDLSLNSALPPLTAEKWTMDDTKVATANLALLNRLTQEPGQTPKSLIRAFGQELEKLDPGERTLVIYRREIAGVKQGFFTSTHPHAMYQSQNYRIVSVV